MPESRGGGVAPDTAWASDALKNLALGLALDWGPDWLQPIQARLAGLAPELDAQQRDALNALAQRVMRFGRKAMEDAMRLRGGQPAVPDLDALRGRLGPEFGWIDHERLSRLHSQSAYYALR